MSIMTQLNIIISHISLKDNTRAKGSIWQEMSNQINDQL